MFNNIYNPAGFQLAHKQRQNASLKFTMNDAKYFNVRKSNELFKSSRISHLLHINVEDRPRPDDGINKEQPISAN